eukprot:gene4853-5642_t
MKRILVVEDDPDVLDMFETVLKEHGYKVFPLMTGRPVFKIIETFKPDLILMDIRLDGMDGRAIFQQLKSNRQTAPIPVMLTSGGFKEDYIMKDNPDYGDYLEKPFEVSVMIRKIEKLLELKLKNIFEGNVIQLNEVDRLENLKNYKIWRTRSEPVFDQLAGIAAALLDVPVAMINFIDRYSIRLEQSSLCSIAIVKGYAASFEKSVADPALISDPLVAGEYGWRFYAATDITTTEGLRIGTICIIWLKRN